MKIELYSVPNDINGIRLEEFLNKNNLKFHKIIVDDINIIKKISKDISSNKISFLRIRYSHSVHILSGFNELSLNFNLVNHINKYHPKIK